MSRLVRSPDRGARSGSRRDTLERFREEIARCVKCGACRAVCPTFLREREESLSPRGRTALVRAVLDRRLPVSKIYRDRLATCTTCLACESVCPNSVPVTRIIGAAKEEAVAEAGRGIVHSLLSEVIRHPALFRAAGWLAPAVLHYASTQKTSSKFKVQSSRSAAKGTIAFFPGCAIEHFQPGVGTAAVTVLRALGYRVIVPEGLRCCGRPLRSLGDRQAAEALAEHNIAVFAGLNVEAIVTACASCGLTFKQEYPTVRPPGARGPIVLDIHELLARELSGTALNPLRETITWHDPCHLGRGQGLAKTVREVLARVPGLTLAEMKNADRCCGFGGVMRITHRALSDGIAEDKVKNIIASGASTVATGCPGCRMQLADALRRAGSDVKVAHTVQIIAAALKEGSRCSAKVRSNKE